MVPEEARARYLDLVRAHIAGLSSVLGDSHIDYVQIDTSQPLDQALFGYLARRARLVRSR